MKIRNIYAVFQVMFDGWQHTAGGILNVCFQSISVPLTTHNSYGIGQTKDGVFSTFAGLLDN